MKLTSLPTVATPLRSAPWFRREPASSLPPQVGGQLISRLVRRIAEGPHMAGDDIKQVAFYYPGHLWHHTDWIKTLLLFFDGVGLLVPEYKKGEPEARDPVLAGPLRERGLLHYLVADQVVDKAATEEWATAMANIVESGMLNFIPGEGSVFSE